MFDSYDSKCQGRADNDINCSPSRQAKSDHVQSVEITISTESTLSNWYQLCSVSEWYPVNVMQKMVLAWSVLNYKQRKIATIPDHFQQWAQGLCQLQASQPCYDHVVYDEYQKELKLELTDKQNLQYFQAATWTPALYRLSSYPVLSCKLFCMTNNHWSHRWRVWLCM